MRERKKGAERSPAERPLEATSERQGAEVAKSARNGKKPVRGEVALDPIVSELMIRRIMAALVSPE